MTKEELALEIIRRLKKEYPDAAAWEKAKPGTSAPACVCCGMSTTEKYPMILMPS